MSRRIFTQFHPVGMLSVTCSKHRWQESGQGSSTGPCRQPWAGLRAVRVTRGWGGTRGDRSLPPDSKATTRGQRSCPWVSHLGVHCKSFSLKTWGEYLGFTFFFTWLSKKCLKECYLSWSSLNDARLKMSLFRKRVMWRVIVFFQNKLFRRTNNV